MTVLTVEGEMDATVIPQFLLAGRQAAPKGGGILVLDLEKVTYMDTDSALAFVELRKLVERRKVMLETANVPSDIGALFTAMGLWTSFVGGRQAA